MTVQEIGKRAKEAAQKLSTADTALKDRALLAMADALLSHSAAILEANALDMDEGKKQGLSSAVMDRLMLNEKRIEEMAQGLREVAELPDPVGEIIHGWKRPNGLVINKVRVPFGVVGIIYEARPNVTVDAAGLCIKTGNAVILRGSDTAFNSNASLVDVVSQAAGEAGLPKDSIQLIRDRGREAANKLMRMHEYVDVLIPRGGAGLIKAVVENSSVPVIETGCGNCHVYVDDEANLEMAGRIIINAKTQRPGVCNAAETLLVHKAIAGKFLSKTLKELQDRGVKIFGDVETRALGKDVAEATEEDWYTEYLDLKLAVRVVESLEEAIAHINKYGTKHSETIVTDNYLNARKFTEEVDAAALYVNASTRFTDGGEFGFGAEIGISTQKLHARGPMGLAELTSSKYVVYGTGQIRE
jgi:glutamate-5-semialdehyde dehydrogenase